MLIGINGFKRAGKDTVGRYLVRKYGFERAAFADLMKLSVAALFDIPVWQVDELKNQSNVFVAIGYKGEPEQKFEGQPSKMWSPIRELDMREFLKRWGTEAHRDVYGEDFHVEALWRDLRMSNEYHRDKKIVITDARFHNELEAILDMGGFNFRVVRPGTKPDGHSSEEIPPPDLISCTIDNGADMYYLEEQIEDALAKVLRGSVYSE